jgi:hypothetical protein
MSVCRKILAVLVEGKQVPDEVYGLVYFLFSSAHVL